MVALESGLETTLALLENIPSAKKCADEICSAVVNKAIHSTRAKTKDLSVQILLLCIELEKQDTVLDNVIKGFNNKVPKIASSCVNFITTALNAFGNKVIQIKSFIKDTIALLEHKDKTVRESAKLLIIEVYRWVGNAITSQISSAKPTIQNELKSEFEKIEFGKIKPTRWLESQKPSEEEINKMQKIKSNSDASDPDEDASETNEKPEEIDPYDLADEVDVLKKIPANFFELLESKNWKERKESLDALETATNNVIKCKPGDYNELLKSLNHVIKKDTNIILVAQAAKLATFLFTSLRKNISSSASMFFSSCLEKFKEKKIAVVSQIRALIDETFKYLSYENCVEQLAESLNQKNPAIKAESALFIYRFLSSLPKNSPRCDKKTVKSICSLLIKTCQDTAPEVRDASFEALGMLMFVVGEKIMTVFLTDLDSIKLDKIKESYTKACELKESSGAQKNEKPLTKDKPKKKQIKSSAEAEDSKEISQEKKVVKKSVTAPKPKKPVKSKPVPGALPSESAMGDETAEQKCKDFFTESLVGQLNAVKWQEKKEALEAMITKVKASESKEIPVQAIIRLMIKKPGLKESNFNILCAKLDLLDATIKTSEICSQIVAETISPELVEKIGDVKGGPGCRKCLTSLADATKFELVAPIVLKAAVQQKNPKNQQESLNWLSENIKLFGQSLQVKELIVAIKELITHKDAGIRSSTVSLCGTLYLYIGDKIKALLSSEKPTTIQLVEAEIEKLKDVKAPNPTMGYASRQQPEIDDDDEEDQGDQEETDNGPMAKVKQENSSKMAKLKAIMTLPNEPAMGEETAKVKCEEFFGNENMQLYSSPKWQERKEALDNFKNKIVAAEANEIPLQAIVRFMLIKPAFKETNFNVLCGKMDLVTEALKNYGPCAGIIAEALAPALIDKIGDVKAGKSCLACLTQTADSTKFDLVATHVMAGVASQKNPKNIQECLGWLADNMRLFGQSLQVKEVITAISSTIGHQNPGVRSESLKLAMTMYTYYGEKIKAMLSDKANAVSLIEAEIAKGDPGKPPTPTIGMAGRIIQAGGKVDVFANLIKEAAAPATTTKKTTEKSAKPPAKKVEEKKPNATITTVKSQIDKSDEEKEDTTTISEGSDSKKPGRKTLTKVRPSAISSKKQAELEAAQAAAAVPILVVNKLLENRLNDEKKRKVLRWDFDAPTKEHVEQLKQQFIVAGASQDFVANLFHTDFKKHLIALDNLFKMLEGAWQDSFDPIETAMANLDILLKWMVLRFFETNPVVQCRGLEFFKVIFTYMAENQQQISDSEIVSFVPYLVNKLGDPKENIRNAIKEIYDCLSEIFNNSKLAIYLMNGFKMKQNKGRQSCLEILVGLLLKNELKLFHPNVEASIKSIGAMVGDKDSQVRTAALSNLVVIYDFIGEKLYKILKDMPSKDRSMVEERIKRTDKTSIMQNVRANAGPVNDTGKGGRITMPLPQPTSLRPNTAPNQDDHSANSPPSNQQQQQRKPKNENVRKILDEIFDREPDPIPQMPTLYSDEELYNELMQPIPTVNISTKPLSIAIKTNSQISSVITLIVTKIQSNIVLECCTALAQIDELIKDSKSFLLNSFIDHMSILINIQLRQTLSRLNEEPGISTSEASMLLRSFLAVLDSLFMHDSLSQIISKDNLKNLISTLLNLLVDENLNLLKDSEQFIRALNGLIDSIIQRGDKTKVTSSLLKLIHEIVQNSQTTTNYGMAILKTSWRIIRSLKAHVKFIDLNIILLDCHNFLKAFPFDYWIGKKSDLPVRTIKTLLHHLGKYKGTKLIHIIEKIPNKNESGIEAYVVKILTKFKEQNEFELVDEDYTEKSGNVHIEVAKIIEKISSDDIISQNKGIRELYEYKQRNPGLDINHYLDKCSYALKSYVNIALENISLQRVAGSYDLDTPTVVKPIKSNILKENQQQNLLPDNNISSSALTTQAYISNSNTEYEEGYMLLESHKEKLNEWRRKLGLPFMDYHGNEQPKQEIKELAPQVKTMSPIQDDNKTKTEVNNQVPKPPSRKTNVNTEELAKIKMRLAQIKANKQDNRT